MNASPVGCATAPSTRVLALLVGAGAGLGAVAFRWLITGPRGLHRHRDYSGTRVTPRTRGPWLGRAFIVLAPARRAPLRPARRPLRPKARGHGVPEVMYAVSQRGGRIPAKVAVVKALASASRLARAAPSAARAPSSRSVRLGSTLGTIHPAHGVAARSSSPAEPPAASRRPSTPPSPASSSRPNCSSPTSRCARSPPWCSPP